MADGFVELSLDLFQTNALRSTIEEARRNRRGIIFMSVAPNVPGPWRLQAVALDQKACARITKIIAEELEPKP
jgi:hypothetical protein